MNMMFAYGNKIVTPMLNGSILPGITRDSVLKLARSLGYEAEETRLDINEIFADAKSGKLTEAFGTGTAAVISRWAPWLWKMRKSQSATAGLEKSPRLCTTPLPVSSTAVWKTGSAGLLNCNSTDHP